ncbi:MAG: hypothetical protein D6782_02950 [Alphaproteobacteria bacterium]|nr:MAG: hypothetical protein D6782_02950 [Alphaproteobacteria bacterium]
MAEGIRRRTEIEEKRMVRVAWITAALMRAEKLPDLARLLGERRPQSPEDRAAAMARWAAAVNAQTKSRGAANG